jgi:hypothetical protein
MIFFVVIPVNCSKLMYCKSDLVGEERYVNFFASTVIMYVNYDANLQRVCSFSGRTVGNVKLTYSDTVPVLSFL